MFRVCIDTGGTFTDGMVLDGEGALHEFKAPTTPWDFSEGVLDTVAEAAGYKVINRFTLPASDWWNEYYVPLSRRIANLKPKATGELAAVLEATEYEIDIFRRFSDYYGSVFFLMKRRP